MTKCNRTNQDRMSTNKEIKYDAADNVKLNDEVNVNLENKHHDGLGSTPSGLCGSPLLRVAQKGANKELIKNMRKDYPLGPHDKPQSMCPAFGSLRVGLRMKRELQLFCQVLPAVSMG